MKKVLLAMVALTILTALAFCSLGCSSSEPIVGEWRNANPKYSQISRQFNGDGSCVETGKLAGATGIWEKYEPVPTVNAGGKEWHVYLVVTGDRLVTGEGRNGNIYEYDDDEPDLFFLVSGDEMVGTFGHMTVESLSKDSGEWNSAFWDLGREYLSYERI